MSKFLSIFTSFLILFQSLNINLDEFTQIDELVEHAFYHAEEYGDDIFVFVSKHYGELKEDHNRNNDEERSEHEQLPFNHLCSSNFTTVFILDEVELVCAEIETVGSKTKFFYQEKDSSFEKTNIFQPPKLS
jgi:hypothetical protein